MMVRMLLAIACLTLLRAPIVAASVPQRPNVLLILVDNVGYGDLGCYGNAQVKTPNIDRLAAEGVRCTEFYIGSPSCSPSRGALLSGRHPERNGLNWQLKPEESFGVGLPKSEKIIPQYLKPLGYATAAFGKWNIGFGEGVRPTERGFDEFFGHASGNINYFTHRYEGWNDLRRGTEEVQVEGYSTDLFAAAAADFIQRHARRSWFVYLPFNAPHFPMAHQFAPGEKIEWQVPAEYLAQYGAPPDEANQQLRFFAVMTALDAAIGRVLSTIDQLGLRGETLVILLSDNGAFMLPGRGKEVQSNRPLREGGVTTYEGGLRVPAIVRWPGRIGPGTVCREPLWSMDLLPLIVKAAGGQLPADRVLDGLDPTATLSRGAPSPHPWMFWVWQKWKAVRSGQYKLVCPPAGKWELYDLSTDVGETTDLAAQMPDLAASLAAEFDKWRAEVKQAAPAP